MRCYLAPGSKQNIDYAPRRKIPKKKSPRERLPIEKKNLSSGFCVENGSGVISSLSRGMLSSPGANPSSASMLGQQCRSTKWVITPAPDSCFFVLSYLRAICRRRVRRRLNNFMIHLPLHLYLTPAVPSSPATTPASFKTKRANVVIVAGALSFESDPPTEERKDPADAACSVLKMMLPLYLDYSRREEQTY